MLCYIKRNLNLTGKIPDNLCDRDLHRTIHNNIAYKRILKSQNSKSEMSIVRYLKYSVVITIFFGIESFLAQEKLPVFNYLNIKDGLSQSTVETIIKDKKGFMWFGTNDGLNRYDGYNFTTYRYDPTDTNSISDNYIYKICEDDSGLLWIATNNGLNMYDPVRNNFTRFLNNPEDSSSLSFNLVHSVLKDRNNNIWVGTLGGGLNLLDDSKMKFVRIKNTGESKTDLNMITSLFEDRKGNIWIGTFSGSVVKATFSDGNFNDPILYSYNLSANTSSESGENIVWDIQEDKNGLLWIATNRTGAVKLNPNSGAIKYYKPGIDKNTLNDFSVRAMFIDNDGSVYFGTKSGGLNILRTDGSFNYILSDDRPGSLNDNSIWSIYKDDKNTLWIGTEFGGINKFDPYRNKFEHFSQYSDDLRKNIVLFFYEENDGNIIIGTDGGIIRFNYERMNFTDIHGANILANDIITAIFKEDKNIWIGTNSRGLFKISHDNKIKRFQSSVRNRYSLSNNNIKVVVKSASGLFWLGTYGGGVDLFDPVNENVLYNLSTKGINENFIAALLEDDNTLWIGTYGDGLISYNTISGEIKRFLHNPSDNKSIINNRVYSLYKDKMERLWVGTTGGLCLFDQQNESFTAYTSKQGLANDVIYSILEDEDGFLWLSTNRGISRFDFQNKSFKNFTPKDGAQDFEFNRGAALRSSDGKLFFGGINGFNVISPTSIKINRVIPTIVITSFKKMNEEVIFSKAISEVDTITLSYKDNFFSFTFAALDFTDPQSNSYAYMMEGFNEDWIYSGNERTATYTNLDAGTYVFRVKGSNNDGIWNETVTSVTVIVLPPFWQTWWFRLLVLMFIIVTLYFIYRVKLLRAIEIERLRTRIASDLHDDIGSSLTRIAMQSELILEDIHKDDYKKPIKEIGEKSRELITTMGDVVWSIDARNDSVANLLDRMKEFSHSLLSRKNISVLFHQEGLDEDKKIPVDLRQDIYLIFKEAINNIAKHSMATEVKISLKNFANEFTMSISDNGIVNTSKSESRKTGHGIKNMRMRAERSGGKIEINIEKGYKILYKRKPV